MDGDSVMGYNYTKEMDFSGGVVYTDALDQLNNNEVASLVNYDQRDIYSLRVREGTVNIMGGFVSGTTKRLIEYEYIDQVTYNKVKRYMQLIGDSIYDAENGDELDDGWGEDEDIDFEVFGNKLYVLGNGRYRVFDGTTWSDVTNSDPESILDEVKKCRFLEQRGSRMFATGNPEVPNALYFSEVNNPASFLGSTGNPFMAITDDADLPTGLKEFNGNLIFFKRNAIFAWSGYDPLSDVQFKRIRAHSGCVAYRTIQYVDDMLMFLGTDGVYALFGTYENAMSTVKLSGNVTLPIRYMDIPDDSLKASPVAIFYKDKYILTFPTESGGYSYVTDDDFLYVTDDDYIYITPDDNYNRNNIILVFHVNVYRKTSSQSWSTYSGLSFRDALVDSTGRALLAMSDNGRIDMFQDGITYDYSSDYPISTVLHTRPISTGEPFHVKKFRRSALLLDLESMVGNYFTVKVFVDDRLVYQSDGVTSQILEWDEDDKSWDVSYWYGEGAVVYPIPVKEKGMRLRYEIESTSLSTPYTLYGIGLEYKTKKPAKESSID